jgi:hypothetical protein
MLPPVLMAERSIRRRSSPAPGARAFCTWRVKVAGSAERYHDEPEKNEYSHPHDALQYVATRVFGDAVRGREEQRKRWSEPLKYPRKVQVV